MRPKHARPATKADETDEFREFWQIWQPVKSEYDGRAAARDGFFRHVWWRGADAADVVDGARYYVKNAKPGQFRMKAAEWMDRGLYEDDAEKWRAMQARLDAQPTTNVVQMGPPAAKRSRFMELWDAGEIKPNGTGVA